MFLRGGDGIRTRVNGFAGRCLASRPPHHNHLVKYLVVRSASRPGDSNASGQRGSNSRPRPWQGRALPAELCPHERIAIRPECFVPFGCVPTSKNSIRRFTKVPNRRIPAPTCGKDPCDPAVFDWPGNARKRQNVPWTWKNLPMTSPALAQQTSFGRMYARKIGALPEVPSITTVIGQEKMDMDGWIGHMAATAVVQDARLGESVGNSA